MNLGIAILALPTETLTIERRTGTYVAGVWTPVPDGAPFDVQAGMQPATGRDMLRAPEGQRKAEGWVLFVASSSGALRLADKDTGALADRFTFRGQLYELDHAEDWATEGYQRCLATMRAV